jgi:hypothetical protein
VGKYGFIFTAPEFAFAEYRLRYGSPHPLLYGPAITANIIRDVQHNLRSLNKVGSQAAMLLLLFTVYLYWEDNIKSGSSRTGMAWPGLIWLRIRTGSGLL